LGWIGVNRRIPVAIRPQNGRRLELSEVEADQVKCVGVLVQSDGRLVEDRSHVAEVGELAPLSDLGMRVEAVGSAVDLRSVVRTAL
jgi:hypothetical protein